MEEVGRHVQARSNAASQVLGRSLQQEEAEAHALHIAHALRHACNGLPAAVVMTLALSWRGRREFRFPFHTPKWTHRNPDRFLASRGRMARANWHIIRANAYFWTSGLATWMAFIGFGALVGQLGAALDPRLKDLNDLSRQNAGALREALDFELGKNRTTSEVAKQLRPAQHWCKESMDGKGSGSTAEPVYDNSPAETSFDDDYHDHYRQTDKKALLEAIRRADGKSVEGEDVPSSSFEAALGSQSSETAWDRLRREAGRQSSQGLEPRSLGNGETYADHTSSDRSEAQR